MAQELLNNLLNLKTSPTEILKWLISDDCNEAQWANFNSCPREEFITFFLDYLREQFISVLQNSNGPKQTPAKKISIKPQTSHVGKSININNQRIETGSSLVTLPLDERDTFKRQAKTNAAQQDSIAFDQAGLLKNCNLENSNVGSIKSPVAKLYTPEKNVLNWNPNSNQPVPSSSPQTSTPVANKRNSSFKKRAELISCNFSEQQNFNPAFKNSVEYEHFTDRREGRNISFDDNSFPSLGGRNSNSFHASNQSRNFTRDESSDLSNSNFSIRSHASVNNKILQSPVSPLYSNSPSMLSPINSKIYQNLHHNSPSNNNFHNNTTSTPERSSHNLSKSSKTTPRQNVSLSDYITVDSLSLKKSVTKKGLSKSWCKNDEQNDDPCNVIYDTSLAQAENTNKQKKRRRKVNPTRLSITDTKGDKENTVFGEVSRPFTQNPQFVNVPPIDKSVDNESFQVERGLVKIERQKKPDIVSNSNVIDEQAKPQFKILQRTPNKINIPTAIIIPDEKLVENVQVLNSLAELYSVFLDNNLVFNPMTELYYVINLITNQYKEIGKPLSVRQNMEKKLQNCNDQPNIDCRYEKEELSTLKKSLNFDDLEDNNDLDSGATYNNDNGLQYDDKTTAELGCSILTDNTKENINLLSRELKGIDVNVDQTKNNQIDIDKEIDISKETTVTSGCVKSYLNTPHNCVYFSTQVLNLQKDFLKYLDRVTLKLLCENNQLLLFQPELCQYLDSVYNAKVSESNKIKSTLNIGIVDLNVCFQTDTDNRENFPSPKSFQDFKKQRDMFYEILKIWEDNHLKPGWTFRGVLGGKIKTLLNVHTDVTNFTHLARLFKSQMLISCIESGQQEDLFDDETLSFLKNVKDMNMEKLTLLKKKLVTPLSQNGPVPPPSFPGSQEFYKDFIFWASPSMFLTYLEDTFINEIMELNNTQFAGSDIEDKETEVDEHTKQSFVICLSSLRLLAKFLGFLTSFPYRSETSMLEDVIASQVALRSKCLPHIDLQYCLHLAVIQGKLSLTVPWIVEYLSMMDHATLRLPYYKRILEMLYCIYRASNYHAVANSDELMSQQTAVLVKLCIGWLFELSVFPTELYYSWQAKFNNKELQLICEKQPVAAIADVEDSIISVKHSLFLDKLEMVDNRILYSCCPFLREFNILLTPGNSNVNNSTSHRHVTPVTSQLQKPVKKGNIKHLEIQLEEAFFHGQPMSIRKTVEYVSERIASCCVKYIYNTLLPVERQKNSASLKCIVEERYGDNVNLNTETVKTALLYDMNVLAMSAAKNIKEASNKIIPKMCESRVNQSVESLLADDCLKPVKEMCVKIATRMAMERIDQWIQSHIMGGSTFIKDMDVELNKVMKENEDVVVETKCHNVNAAAPTDILDGFREIIWNIYETRGQLVNKDNLIKFLDQSYLCLTERSDISMASEKVIGSLSIDLCLFLISHRHDLLTKEVQDKVFKVWKVDSLKLSESDSPLSRILCPRNIMLLGQTFDALVWQNFGRFLNNLLKENILTIDSLTEQAVALFRREWPKTTSNNLSTCFELAIADYKSTDEETERIRCLLKWVARACNDMDCDGFNFSLD